MQTFAPTSAKGLRKVCTTESPKREFVMTGVKRQPGDVWRDLRSHDAVRAEVARMDLCAMTPAELLAEATAAGLSVSEEDGRLVVRGPKEAGELARHLVGRKAELLPAVRAL